MMGEETQRKAFEKMLTGRRGNELPWFSSLLTWNAAMMAGVPATTGDHEATLCERGQDRDTEARRSDGLVVCLQLDFSYVKGHNFTCVSHYSQEFGFSS